MVLSHQQWDWSALRSLPNPPSKKPNDIIMCISNCCYGYHYSVLMCVWFGCVCNLKSEFERIFPLIPTNFYPNFIFRNTPHAKLANSAHHMNLTIYLKFLVNLLLYHMAPHIHSFPPKQSFLHHYKV